MLDIFENSLLNQHANDYFLMLFNFTGADIESQGRTSAFMEIFPHHLVRAEMKKCKKIYKELYSWVLDEFLHKDFRPIHDYVLYKMLENQPEPEDEDTDAGDPKDNKEKQRLKANLSSEEAEFLDNINNANFYIDFLFDDDDFLSYKDYYDMFGTPLFNQMGYDNRIVELLPRDKRKEIKNRLKNKKTDSRA